MLPRGATPRSNFGLTQGMLDAPLPRLKAYTLFSIKKHNVLFCANHPPRQPR
jgi:hypothetical protein